MKKTLVLIICAFSFGTHQGMEQAWKTVKKAVSGNTKRDYLKEIESLDNDTSLTQVVRLRKKAGLYTKLRNQNRGKEEHEQYNALAESCRSEAQALENQERKTLAEELRKEALSNEESLILSQIKEIKKEKERTYACRAGHIADCYGRLAEAFEHENQTKFDTYNNLFVQFYNKKKYLHNYDLLQETTDRVKKINLLRTLEEQCDNPDRAQQHNEAANKLEAELQAEIKDKTHQELVALLIATSDKSQKATICRSIAQVCPDLQSPIYLAHADRLEQEAVEEQKQQQLIVNRTCHIVGLNAEITKTENDEQLTRFSRIDKLARLLEQRAELSKGVPNFEVNCAPDLVRARKLRTESIALAPTIATQQAIIRALKS